MKELTTKGQTMKGEKAQERPKGHIENRPRRLDPEHNINRP
jgi:hypothetical protein